MKTKIKLKKHLFGTRKSDGANIYISAPSWDCDWYWSFGYLGNNNEHYHLDSYQSKDHCLALKDGTHMILTEKRNKHMHDCLLEDYDLVPRIKENLWTFCELALTAYSLKNAAEVLGQGGSYTTTNPAKDIILNKDTYTWINETALPAVFKEIEKLFNTPCKSELEKAEKDAEKRDRVNLNLAAMT